MLMKWYHVTLLCWQNNQNTFRAAFNAIFPDNLLSANWNFLNTECIVKAPAGLSVFPVVAVYDSPPVGMATSSLWTG